MFQWCQDWSSFPRTEHDGFLSLLCRNILITLRISTHQGAQWPWEIGRWFYVARSNPLHCWGLIVPFLWIMSTRGTILSPRVSPRLGWNGLFTSSCCRLSVHINTGINPPPPPQPWFTKRTNGHLSRLNHNETEENHIRASVLQLTGLTNTKTDS